MLARLRKMQEENEEGFTLIELLVVIIIIGILAAIAIPVFLSQRQKGYDAGIKSDLRNMATAEESYLTDNPTSYADDSQQTALSGEGFKSSSAGDYDSSNDGIFIGIDGNNGYCLYGFSASGKIFQYDSQAGGLQSGSVTTVPTSCSFGGHTAITYGTTPIT
jgi:type IV pilus assembly protein PilA